MNDDDGPEVLATRWGVSQPGWVDRGMWTFATYSTQSEAVADCQRRDPKYGYEVVQVAITRPPAPVPAAPAAPTGPVKRARAFLNADDPNTRGIRTLLRDLADEAERLQENLQIADERGDAWRAELRASEATIEALRSAQEVPAAPADDEVRYGLRREDGYLVGEFVSLQEVRWCQEKDGLFTGWSVVEIRPVPPDTPVYEVTVRFTSRDNAERASQGTLTSVTLSKLIPRSPWHGAEVGPVVEKEGTP